MNRGRRITPLPPHILVKVFEEAGFRQMRQRGDHLIMTRQGTKRPLVIKTGSHPVPVSHILTNLRTAGIEREEYFRLLERVQ